MTQRNYKEKNVQEMNMEDLINTVSDDLKGMLDDAFDY